MRSSTRIHNKTWACLVMAYILILVAPSHATLVCDSCRPIELQEGPGVGLSLSPSHGAVSVEFVNGTVVDIGFIEGTEAYVQAVKSWPKARLVWPIPSQPSFLQRLLYYLGLQKPRKVESQLPQSLMPVVDMIQALWQNANASIYLHHKKVRLSVPDFAVMDVPLQQEHTKFLAAAGLESLRQSPMGKSALLSLYNLGDCFYDSYDEIMQCEMYRGRPIKTVLSIHLDKRSMSLLSMIRDDGMFYPSLGDAKSVWTEDETNLEDEISQFNAMDFDLVSLSGPEASQVYGILDHLFRGSAKILPEDYVRSHEDHAFATARGSARLARLGMCNEWEVCIPNRWCQVSKHCAADFYSWPNETKDEL